MNRAFKSVSCLVTVMFLSACSTIETPQHAQEGDASAQDPTRIQFTQPLHFSAPEGSDVVVQAGTYRVEQATGSQIRLVPSGDGLPILLSAKAVSSGIDVAAPIALALPFEPDAYDLVLLVPGGQVLETRGSVSGVLPRGVSSRLRAILVPPLAFEVQQPPGPDLWVRSIFRGSCPEPGNVVFTVINSGTETAGPSTARVNKGGGPATVQISALAPGQSQGYFVYDSCSAFAGGGDRTCSVTVHVDVMNAVPESNEINNSRSEVVCRH